MTMRAAIYARVSSATQRDRHTIESQLRTLPEFVRSRGWELAGEYTDDGRSAKAGKLALRTGLAALLRDAAAGRFDVVAVVDVDRLTRSEDLTERGAILGGLQRAGVKVAIQATGQILDFSESTGDLYGSLQAFFAAEWGRKHRARIMEGKLTAIGRGKKPAGPTPYGYRYDRANGVWSIDELEGAIVREIFARAPTETAYQIADDLHARGLRAQRGGEWTAHRVYAILRRDCYRGVWTADKRRKLTIPIPRLVTDAAFYAVRDRVAAKARQVAALRRTRNVYMLEGLATCAECGKRIGIASAIPPRGRTAGVPARYVCPDRRQPARGVERCRGAWWRVEEVDRRVWESIRKLISRPDLIDRVVRRAKLEAGEDSEAWRGDLAAAEKRIERLDRVEAGILKRYRADAISEEAFDRELATIGRERSQAHQQADAARAAQFAAGRRISRATALEALVVELRAAIADAGAEERREIAAVLVPVGAIRLGISTIELEVELGAPVAARPTTGIALVDSAG